MRLMMLRRLYDKAASGLPLLGTPEETAERYRLASASPDRVAQDMSRRYVMLCGATGFVCGLPGYASMPLTIPSNVAGVLLLQCHMCAAMAVLAGEDPRSEEVRERAVRCLQESENNDRDTATDGDAVELNEESEGLFRRVATKLGERGIRMAGEQATRWIGRAARKAGRNSRSLPLLGGAVGGFTDGYTARQVAHRARQEFLRGVEQA